MDIEMFLWLFRQIRQIIRQINTYILPVFCIYNVFETATVFKCKGLSVIDIFHRNSHEY